MRVRFFRFVFILMLLSNLFFYFACKRDKILIGFAGEITGINSDLGVYGRNGAILAAEEINAIGGINGREVKLLIKDDEGLPEKAVKVTRELIDSGVTAIIGHMTSSQTMVSLPIIEKEKVILLSPTTSTPKLTGLDDFFFRVQGSSGYSARALGKFSGTINNLDHVLVIRDIANNDYTEPFKYEYLSGFLIEEKKSFKEITFSSTEDIFWNRKFKKIDTSEFQGVFIIASPRSTASIIQALKNKNENLIFMSSSWGATHSLIMHGGGAVEGTFVSLSGVVDKSLDEYKIFQEKYKNRFGQQPSFAANHGYHALKLLAIGLAKNGGKREGLKEALLSIDKYKYFHGGRGFDRFGDSYLKAVIFKVEDGKFVEISQSFNSED